MVLRVFDFETTANAQTCHPAMNGLVSWYQAEGSAADAQNHHPGILRNGTAFAAGKIGQGFKFDGVDDFVEIADSTSLKPQNLTIEAWVKFDNLVGATSGNAPAGFQYILLKKNTRQFDNFEGYSLIKLSNHRLAFSISGNNGAQTTLVDNTQTVEIGKYYHLAGTYDGVRTTFYVNGQKVGEANHETPLGYDTRPVFIGSSGETIWDGKMNGVIDETKIYNRALPDAEIKANYLTGAMLVNCDAEADPTATGDGTTNHDVTGWENEVGNFTVARYAATGGGFPSVSDPGPAMRDAFFFTGGSGSAASSGSQTINLSDYAARIDAGTQRFRLSGFLGGYANQEDNARLTVVFRDSDNNTLASATIDPVTVADRGGQTGLLARETFGMIPVGTRSVEVTLLFTSFLGGFNDGYADNVSFALVEPTNAPNNLISWYGGDGDARDFQNTNNGTLVANPSFVIGKVGQAFRFQNDSHLRINSNSIFRGQTEGTIETWVRPRGSSGRQYGYGAIAVESEQSPTSTRFGLYYQNIGQIAVFANNSQFSATSPAAIAQNEWTHVAATYKAGETTKLYLNGVVVAQSTGTAGAFNDADSAFVGVGALINNSGDNFSFNGDIDETSFYTRSLSAGEIQSIYNAGTTGKQRRVATGAGANVANLLRDADVTFSNVTAAGETAQTPLEISTLPPLPSSFAHTGLAYDISTTAAFSGNIDVCFNLPALVGERFARLKILHLENGSWVDRTTNVNSPQLCGRVSSLSPFAIAENLAPTAASVTVGGRVTAGKRGVSRARISLTNTAGETRYALTNQFGYYHFADIPAGATYILSASSKQYVFTPPTQVLFIGEDVADANFTAQPKSGGL